MARSVRPAQSSCQPSVASRLTDSVIIVDLNFPTAPQTTVLVPLSAVEHRPSYDARYRELWYLDQLIKRFRHPAKNQQCLLEAFQEQDWMDETDDPLAPQGDTLPSKRLSDTIAALNSHHENAGLLRFVTYGGQRAGWMPGPAAQMLFAARETTMIASRPRFSLRCP